MALVNRSWLVLLLGSLLALGACEKKSPIEKAEDKVNDALDRRPGEEFRDAAENAGAAAKDFGHALERAAKGVAHEAKETASDVAKQTSEAAREVKDSAKEAVGR